MRRIPAWAALAAAALLANAAWSQDGSATGLPELASESGSLGSIPAALISEALTVSILATVGKPSETPTWEAKDVKYTIPGTPVSVKMIGRDTVIVITITPYKNKGGGLLLVAQGQVWYKDSEKSIQYRTTVDTLSVRFGERVLFYPFGAKPETGAPLRVELVMDAYAPEEGGTDGQPTAQAAMPATAPVPAQPSPAQAAPSPAATKDKAKP